MIGTLRDLLVDFCQADAGEDRDALEENIWNQFGAERTVLVLDMSGFSMLTRRYGVVHYLSMVRRMHDTVRPVVHEHDGSIVKFEADNAFAVFPDPESAVDFAMATNRAIEVENRKYATDFALRLSYGIDHGRILLLEGKDFFGDAVNTASKLGEDLARPGEILVARRAVDEAGLSLLDRGKAVKFSISGIQLEAVSISY
jgi:class 3 adenylate cyclase